MFKTLSDPTRRPMIRGVAAMALGGALLATAGIAGYLWQMQRSPDAPWHRSDQGIRLDPWRPLPGCLLLRDGAGKASAWTVDEASKTACLDRPGLASVELPMASQGLKDLLRVVDYWRKPLQASPERPMQKFTAPNGLVMDQGADVELSLDPHRQGLADDLVACMTGRLDRCTATGIPALTWQHHAEQAATRSAALLVMDVATGRIEVASSAFSPCYSAEHEGHELPAHCPPSVRPEGRAQLWKLESPALFANEMPGSLVKLLLILAILRDPILGAEIARPGPARDKFFEDVKHSDTPAFLDRVFCRDQSFADCGRVALASQAARDLGWNASTIRLADLGVQDTPALAVPSGRMLQRFDPKTKQWHDIPGAFPAAAARRCAEKSPGDKRWTKCSDQAVANLASEIWGQGSSRTSPVAVAAMLGRLASAANGQASQPLPHLVNTVSGQVHGQAVRLAPSRSVALTGIASDHARLMLEALSQTHQAGGTAYLACFKALGGNGAAAKACTGLKGISGKTGTPTFNHDKFSVTERARVCDVVYARKVALEVAGKPPTASDRDQFTQCQMRPIKWYAAALRADPGSASGPYTKVLVVLAERNWRLNGRIDSAFDRGTPNIAAELAFRYLNALHSLAPTGAKS